MAKRKRRHNGSDDNVKPASKGNNPPIHIGRISKLIWTAIGILAVIVGLFMNLTLDLPQILSNWLISPTSLPFPRAIAEVNEVLVIVTEFTGTDGEAVATRIFRALTERVQTSGVENVRIEWLPAQPQLSEDAIKIGIEFDATLVIWGTADEYGVEPRYEVVRYLDKVKIKPDLGITVAIEKPTFNSYVVLNMPKEFEYLLLFSLGQISFFSEDYEKALDYFTQALNMEFGDRSRKLDFDTVYSYRGQVYEEYLKDTDAALDDYTHAIEIDPQDPIHYVLRAQLLTFGTGQVNDSNLKSAIIDYSFAIELDQKNSANYLNRGTAYHVLGNLQAALDDYTKAIEFDLSYTPAYFNRGTLYSQKGDFSRAEADFTTAIKLVSDGKYFDIASEKAEAYRIRGRFYINRGEHEKAIDDLTQAIKFAPNEAAHYNDRAVAYIGLGRYRDALNDLNKVLTAIPDSPAGVYSNRGLVQYYLENYDEAILDLKHSIDVDPTIPTSYFNLGHIYYVLNRRREALETWRVYLTLVGENADPEVVDRVQELEVEFSK